MCSNRLTIHYQLIVQQFFFNEVFIVKRKREKIKLSAKIINLKNSKP